MSILTDLHRQRQTIEHSRDTLHGADDNIARARKVRAEPALKAIRAGDPCWRFLCLSTLLLKHHVGACGNLQLRIQGLGLFACGAHASWS